MIRLAIAQDPQSPASVKFYRSTGPVSFLEKQFPELRVDYLSLNQLFSSEMTPFPYDVIFIERAITPQALEAVKVCKNMGVVTWVDYDDNLFQIPDYNQAQDFFSIQGNLEVVQKIISLADLVTVSTPHLQKLYGGMNPNVQLIQNAWCDFRFPIQQNVKPVSSPIKMAWRGANKHDGDLYEVRNTIALSINDPAFDWTFYGIRPHYLQVKRQNYRPFSGLFSYLKRFILSETDFLFVPLVVNDFNRSKSNCAWIEATLAGAVTIAPMGLPEFDQPGLIRYKDNAHLKSIFQKIKKGGYDKSERVQASQKALIENFALSKVNVNRAEALFSFFRVKEKEHV